MAQFKLNDGDEKFLALPQGAVMIFGGATGTETWIERKKDTIVGISMKSVAICTADGGTLAACIEVGGGSAKGQDGPSSIETQIRVSQSVQVLVKAGERLAFKAYATATNALVLRTVVWASDMEDDDKQTPALACPSPNDDPSKTQEDRQQNVR